MTMLVDTNFYAKIPYNITLRDAIYIECSVNIAPPEECSAAFPVEYFLYSQHLNDLHAVSHFITMANPMGGISVPALQMRKPMDTENLNGLPIVSQVVNCKLRI